MNQAFLSGYLDGPEVNGVEAVLAPRPGECCVRLGLNGTAPDDTGPEGTAPDDTAQGDPGADDR
ncbi:hypothetical protein ACF06P_34060 [Streptomyces sp. NPDC015684]|uniref:hypothetical protein n=1 Tax=Streptomyces sp. NPDC015684 TaxID=3364963 RepID=UPI0036F5A286